MPPRPRISDAQILDAAREVFLEAGSDATTLAVAARAGVSEALVFKRFHTKEALFDRAMAGVRPASGGRPAWVAELERADLSMPDQLERLALGMLESMRAEMPRNMMVWSRHPGNPHWSAGHSAPVQGLKLLSVWLERQMHLGRMRRSDPEMFGRVFCGAIVSHAMSEMTGLADQMPISTPTFVRGLVDALWRGACPTPSIS